MAQQSELDRLESAWRALKGETNKEGWQTIPIERGKSRLLLAGRHFPDNLEAILIGFQSIRWPSEGQLPEGQGFHVKQIKHKIPSFTHEWIALSRQSVGSLDMFARMAEDVVSMIRAYEHVDDQTLFSLFLGRIKAWQKFMQQGRAELLNLEEEIGLVGELHFLKILLQNGIHASMVIDAWQGPLDGLHDFLLGSGAIEVKSTAVTHAFPATISSLEQLDTSIVHVLFLVGIRFIIGAGGMTLPEIVDEIMNDLEDKPDAKGKFESLLLRSGFIHAFSARYKRRFSHSDTRILLVNNEFPALTRDNVYPAILRTRYVLDLDQIAAPRLELHQVFQGLKVTT